MWKYVNLPFLLIGMCLLISLSKVIWVLEVLFSNSSFKFVIWSDRGSSPRAPLLSPLFNVANESSITQEIKDPTELTDKNIKLDNSVNNLLNNLIQEADNFNDSELLTAVKETFKEDISLKIESSQSPSIEVPQPDIIVNSNSGSDSSMDHFFPKPEINIQHTDSKPELTQDDQIPKSAFNSLFDSIRNRRKDITNSPNMAQLGLQNQQSLGESSKLSPLLTNKPSLNNLFEDTLNLFNDNPIDTGIDTSSESSNKNETLQADVPQERPKLPSNLLQQINSKRLEYGSPEIKSHNEITEVQQQIEDNESSEDDPLDPWKEVKINVKTGDVFNRTVDIDFGELRDKVTKIMIFTNDGEYNYFNPNLGGKSQVQTFRWDNKGISNHYYKDLEIFKIVAMDGNKSHDIYFNKDVKLLPSYLEYLENYGK
jgi:hypothetical protein